MSLCWIARLASILNRIDTTKDIQEVHRSDGEESELELLRRGFEGLTRLNPTLHMNAQPDRGL